MALRYEVRFLDVTVQGQRLRLAYRDVSPAARAVAGAVLLLHGKNFSGAYWEETIEALAAAGYRVVAPDQIGFGRSSHPDLHYSFHLLATLTAQLLDAIGLQRVAVVGHSMGGMLAARFALLFPDRVTKLVLEDPIGLEDYRQLVPYLPLEKQYEMELGQTGQKMLDFQKAYYVQWRPEFEAWVREQAEPIASGEWPRFALASSLTYEMIYQQPILYELPALRVPTLLVIGDKDRTVVGKARLPPELRSVAGNYPELGRKASRAIPGSRLVEVPDVGHIPHLEAPKEFRRILLGYLAE